MNWMNDNSTLLVREMQRIEHRSLERLNNAQRKEKIKFVDSLNHEEFQELLEVWVKLKTSKNTQDPVFVVRKHCTEPNPLDHPIIVHPSLRGVSLNDPLMESLIDRQTIAKGLAFRVKRLLFELQFHPLNGQDNIEHARRASVLKDLHGLKLSTIIPARNLRGLGHSTVRAFINMLKTGLPTR